jgi:MFS family permease
MGRGAVAVVTGIATAPLFALLAFWLTDLSLTSGGGPDGALANAYFTTLMGLLGGLAGGIGAAFITAWRLPARLRPHFLIADAILVVGLIAGWGFLFAEPSPLEYADARPVLEAEIRVPQGLGVDAIDAISFNEGLLDSRHDELVRNEDGFTILPWETTPYRVAAWEIQVIIANNPKWTRFVLDLPRRPTQSTEWSGWLMPTAGEALDLPADVALRYRFRLIPYGQ